MNSQCYQTISQIKPRIESLVLSHNSSLHNPISRVYAITRIIVRLIQTKKIWEQDKPVSLNIRIRILSSGLRTFWIFNSQTNWKYCTFNMSMVMKVTMILGWGLVSVKTNWKTLGWCRHGMTCKSLIRNQQIPFQSLHNIMQEHEYLWSSVFIPHANPCPPPNGTREYGAGVLLLHTWNDQSLLHLRRELGL